MALRDTWTRIVTLRSVVKSLSRMADAQEQQTRLLQRIADRIAPEIPEPTEAELRSTGVSYSRDAEQAALEEWRDLFRSRIGREPSEMEEMEYLDELMPAARQDH